MIPCSDSNPLYSYRSFSISDKSVKEYDETNLTIEDLALIDNVNVYSNAEMINAAFEDCSKEIIGDNSFNRCYFFNDHYIKMKSDDLTDYYFRYILSEDDGKKKDNRILTIIIYKYNKDLEEMYKEKYSYRIKVAHAFQVYKDIDNTILTRNNYDKINMYVLPIYLYNNEIDRSIWSRISNIRSSWEYEETCNVLNTIEEALKTFLATNYILITNSIKCNNKEKAIDKKYNKKITSYIKEATENKVVKVKIKNDTDDIEINLNGNKNNINYNTCRAKCDYRYTVAGHFHTYWCGPNKSIKIKKWVNQYTKNNDKEFSITKVYE